MKEEWWEQPVCWLCNYWWLFLLLILILLTAFFTRRLWLPEIGISAPDSTPSFSPPTFSAPTSMSVPTNTAVAAIETATPAFQLYGYVNEEGGYAINYPSDWQGEEVGTDAYFELPNKARLEIIVRPLQAGETIGLLMEEQEPLSIPKSNLESLIVSGEPAIRYNILNSQGQIVARVYQILHAERVYCLTLSAPPDIDASAFSRALDQFDRILLDFFFVP